MVKVTRKNYVFLLLLLFLTKVKRNEGEGDDRIELKFCELKRGALLKVLFLVLCKERQKVREQKAGEKRALNP